MHIIPFISSCRRRKRKCDGARPICGACARLSLPCAYPPTNKKRGPQAGIVKRLKTDGKSEISVGFMLVLWRDGCDGC